MLCLKLVLLVKVNCSCLILAMSHCLIQHRWMVSLYDVLPHTKMVQTAAIPTENSNFKASRMTWISREVWWMPFDVKHGWVSLSAKSLLRHAMTQLRITGKISTLLEKPARFPLLTVKSNWQQHDRCGLDKDLIWWANMSLSLFLFHSVFFLFFFNREWFEKADASFETQHRLLGC